MAAQLALADFLLPTPPPRPRTRSRPGPRPGPLLCAACRAREARYGFRPDDADPLLERPRTLCFECFRAEIGRRHEADAPPQARLPLEHTLASLRLRRRRAQIAARHALAAS